MEPFNPTMVWFYLCKRPSSFHQIYTFNPTMVWFYPAETLHRRARKTRTFNPTMVWFYPIDAVREWCETGEVAFQSHYGLILSLSKLSVHVRFFDLSIPLWSDFIIYNVST